MFSLKKKPASGRPDLRLLTEAGARVVDVRSAQEFNAGHVPGSVNIPLDELMSRLPEVTFWARPVITVCRSGMRSAAASEILGKAGVQAHNAGSWEEFLETVKSRV